jgi:hypothetical protein
MDEDLWWGTVREVAAKGSARAAGPRGPAGGPQSQRYWKGSTTYEGDGWMRGLASTPVPVYVQPWMSQFVRTVSTSVGVHATGA